MRTLLVSVTTLFLFTVSVAHGGGNGDSGVHNHNQQDEHDEHKTDKSHKQDGDYHDEDQVPAKGVFNGAPEEKSNHTRTTTDHHKEVDQTLLRSLLPGLAGAPNIHPMIVHFPIALFVVASVLILLSWKWKPDELLLVSKWFFWIGVGVLPIAVATGFFAIGGWGNGHVVAHRNLMLITSGLAFILAVLAFLIRKKGKRIQRIVLTIGLVVISITMTLGADRGAWLVFVEGSGVQSEGHRHNGEH